MDEDVEEADVAPDMAPNKDTGAIFDWGESCGDTYDICVGRFEPEDTEALGG